MVEHPRIHQVGRYLFYGLCAFGLSLLAHACGRTLGLPKWLIGSADMTVMFGAFMALRDIEANAEARVRAMLQGHKP
jgi:hypothetical protein